jgi:hypothetical protein
MKKIWFPFCYLPCCYWTQGNVENIRVRMYQTYQSSSADLRSVLPFRSRWLRIHGQGGLDPRSAHLLVSDIMMIWWDHYVPLRGKPQPCTHMALRQTTCCHPHSINESYCRGLGAKASNGTSYKVIKTTRHIGIHLMSTVHFNEKSQIHSGAGMT